MSPEQRYQLMLERFAALDPEQIALIDDSEFHVGHAGAAGGAGHYRVKIVSAKFAGLGRLARHRLVYHQIADLMPHEIHALNIEALVPGES